MKASSSTKGIRIIFEDNHLLVVEKPVNVPSQQDDTNDPDMLSLLKEDIKVRYNKPGEVFLGLVHRLDRPVGGVMVFARTSKAASRLSEQIRTREFKKVYLAVIHGMPAKPSGRLEDYLLKDKHANKVSVVDSEVDGAKQAVLDYEVIGSAGQISLVRIMLHTGRSHQIRVQFASIGHPLYGDQKYGAALNKPGQQLALWSNEIMLVHPTLKQVMAFRCEPPHTEPWSTFRV